MVRSADNQINEPVPVHVPQVGDRLPEPFRKVCGYKHARLREIGSVQPGLEEENSPHPILAARSARVDVEPRRGDGEERALPDFGRWKYGEGKTETHFTAKAIHCDSVAP